MVDLLFLLHAVLLLALYLVVGRIHKLLKQLKTAATVSHDAASPKPAAPGAVKSGSSKPTIDALQVPDKASPFVAPVEWDAMSEAELDAVAQIKAWCAEFEDSFRFESVPYDLLVAMVRGYQYRPDWHEALFAYIDSAWQWRARLSLDQPPAMLRTGAGLPPKRELFERMIQSGPVGSDAEGHPVILERNCVAPAPELLAAFPFDLFERNMAYNRECQRACLTVASVRASKRMYKCVLIADFQNMSLGYTQRGMLDTMRGINSVFSFNYPESVVKIYIINAPFVFTALFSIVKQFLHPITVAKLDVFGRSQNADVEATLRSRGITLDAEKLPPTTNPPSWSATMLKLRKELPEAQLLSGYLPEVDVAAFRRRGMYCFEPGSLR